MNILITGQPGIGKTTLIKKLVQALNGKVGGFYTEEIRESNGQRTGFKIETLDGQSGILASIHIKSPYKVGKYNVNLEEFEKIALTAIETASSHSKIVIIDEIGPMELYSEKFKKFIIKTLDSPCHVIATIKQKSLPFTNAIKSRRDIIMYTLTSNTQKEILDKIYKLLKDENYSTYN